MPGNIVDAEGFLLQAAHELDRPGRRMPMIAMYTQMSQTESLLSIAKDLHKLVVLIKDDLDKDNGGLIYA